MGCWKPENNTDLAMAKCRGRTSLSHWTGKLAPSNHKTECTTFWLNSVLAITYKRASTGTGTYVHHRWKRFRNQNIASVLNPHRLFLQHSINSYIQSIYKLSGVAANLEIM